MSIIKNIKKSIPYSLKKNLRLFIPAKPLIRYLPLAMPQSIHIDPCNICNFKCVFCPTADDALLKTVNRPRMVMDMDLFSKIVNDLVLMREKYKTHLNMVHVYKDGEPLINKKLPEMIKMIKMANVSRVISTTTNGSLLDCDNAELLLESGLDVLRISVEETDSDGYHKVTRTDTPYEKILGNVGNLYRLKKEKNSRLHIIVKITDSGLGNDRILKFYHDFQNISDEIRVDTLMGWSYSEKKDFTLGRTVTTGMDGKTNLHERRICPEPFSKCAINSDGTVSVCCVDWSQKTIIGDVKVNSFDEIWNGHKLKEFRMSHVNGTREDIAPCNKCQYLKGFKPVEDLDKYKNRLLRIYR